VVFHWYWATRDQLHQQIWSFQPRVGWFPHALLLQNPKAVYFASISSNKRFQCFSLPHKRRGTWSWGRRNCISADLWSIFHLWIFFNLTYFMAFRFQWSILRWYTPCTSFLTPGSAHIFFSLSWSISKSISFINFVFCQCQAQSITLFSSSLRRNIRGTRLLFLGKLVILGDSCLFPVHARRGWGFIVAPRRSWPRQQLHALYLNIIHGTETICEVKSID